ncbi:MAG: pyridoxamine 5'-phosphate oxidase family protein [Bosea sp. (in: a-proteobacteria)]|uniref:pyridoxamine 5'-phosphate oxidase family protein n=1 Tax=unclassified Bosea (in: a-proteobacteria) TaxID=2653178 RepID=UPI00095FC7EB|nr:MULTISPECIES: pyridoxamine 5'-phosphate oxidase family protein [unclassified Bosea (in: a-proteobacteria)]MBN9457462.1 pyridoxamine 5'-phosphate oxidase family protein [Bosea sp. (in: a-proteobacteria)]OJV09571.1 MAG: general stress protein [Bosea sp. 67-29]
MSRHDQDRVWELIDSIRFAMLVTHDGDGEELRARPMHAHGRREEDTVYFLTDRRHHKDDEIQINDNICLAFADPDGHRYLSVSGVASVLDDRALVRELWESAYKAFWDSADDPDIRVLRVRPVAAELWDSPGKLVTSVKMAAAALTGARPQLGDHRKVRL